MSKLQKSSSFRSKIPIRSGLCTHRQNNLTNQSVEISRISNGNQSDSSAKDYNYSTYSSNDESDESVSANKVH